MSQVQSQSQSQTQSQIHPATRSRTRAGPTDSCPTMQRLEARSTLRGFNETIWAALQDMPNIEQHPTDLGEFSNLWMAVAEVVLREDSQPFTVEHIDLLARYTWQCLFEMGARGNRIPAVRQGRIPDFHTFVTNPTVMYQYILI